MDDRITCGHVDKGYYGLGLCSRCGLRKYRAERKSGSRQCPSHPDNLVCRNGICRECMNSRRCANHPDRHATQRGLCNSCYVVLPGLRHGIEPGLWLEYIGNSPTCDVCGSDNPGHPKGWRIDHAHGHGCRNRSGPYAERHGCIDCVRANLCHRCNQAEGFVADMMARRLIDAVTGPLAVLHGPIEDTPFQRWRRKREAQAA